MPFEIVRNDITNMTVDAVVNTANPDAVIGSGVDAGIHRKAGLRLFLARKKIGRIQVGEAAITPAYDMPADYVIHTAAPVWQGGNCGEKALLGACYRNALRLAKKHKCESIAFPLLSAGNNGFSASLSLQVAIEEFGRFLMENEMKIYLVVFDRQSFQLSEKLFSSVQSFIDENYVKQVSVEERRLPEDRSERAAYRRNMPQSFVRDVSEPTAALPALQPSCDIEEMLAHLDAGFSETLLHLIDRSGKKDAEIYKRANVDRKLFSKIRNNPHYKPSKPTALAFAIALELDLGETRDFIGRAGYALSHSSKFDIIVEYFILQKNYNIMELNEVLFAFDQPLIGG